MEDRVAGTNLSVLVRGLAAQEGGGARPCRTPPSGRVPSQSWRFPLALASRKLNSSSTSWGTRWGRMDHWPMSCPPTCYLQGSKVTPSTFLLLWKCPTSWTVICRRVYLQTVARRSFLPWPIPMIRELTWLDLLSSAAQCSAVLTVATVGASPTFWTNLYNGLGFAAGEFHWAVLAWKDLLLILSETDTSWEIELFSFLRLNKV